MFSLLKEVKVNGSIGKDELPIFSAKEPGGRLNVRVTLFIVNMLVAQVIGPILQSSANQLHYHFTFLFLVGSIILCFTSYNISSYLVSADYCHLRKTLKAETIQYAIMLNVLHGL